MGIEKNGVKVSQSEGFESVEVRVESPLETLIDNRPKNTLKEAMERLFSLAARADLATGYFHIGALSDFMDLWDTVEAVPEIRLVFGDEAGRQTRAVLLEALEDKANEIEEKKEADDWGALSRLGKLKAAIKAGRIQPRVYTKAKFHAKAYRFETGGVVNHGLIGSGNFTTPGLTQNLELNLFTSDNAQLAELAQWFEQVWDEAEEVREDVLRAIERHVREYLPFEVYLRAMRAFVEQEQPQDVRWEQTGSRIYPKLSRYQREAYFSLREMAKLWGGALLCDGVGLGKTYVALMLIEKALVERQNVLLIVPKSTEESVWVSNLNRHLSGLWKRQYGTQVVIKRHTDFGPEEWNPNRLSEEDFRELREFADIIIVDEAHHFRTPSSKRTQRLYELCEGKQLYLLTATPINNKVDDLMHLIKLFSRENDKLFKGVGAPSLEGWFFKLRKELEETQDLPQAELKTATLGQRDEFLKNLIVQRSRKYVKELPEEDGAPPVFPEREKPQVIDYNLSAVYPALLPGIMELLDKDAPKLTLAIYSPESYKRGEKDTELLNRDSQIVGLIRHVLLKRLESSFEAFQSSVENLLMKHASVFRVREAIRWEAWVAQHSATWEAIQQHCAERGVVQDDEEENELPEAVEEALNPVQYQTEKFLRAVEADMTNLANLLRGLFENVGPANDHKFARLLEWLKSRELAGRKVVIFTEFRDTARYLGSRLQRELSRVSKVDSTNTDKDRQRIIKRFAPWYNCTEKERDQYLADPIDILVSTDVLSEGLNLQDCNIIVNYDLHWNPVRLMQRIGRVDRRMDPSITAVNYRKVYVYNFLPPAELEKLLRLESRITGKLKAINRTLGIEAPVLHPDDEAAALDLFQRFEEGEESPDEQIRLLAAALKEQFPELWEQVASFPNRIYSGKCEVGELEAERPIRGMFFCYRIPAAPPPDAAPGVVPQPRLRWLYYDAATGEILQHLNELLAIHDQIKCKPDSARAVIVPEAERTRIRREVEKVINILHMNAGGIQSKRPELLCWMEVS